MWSLNRKICSIFNWLSSNYLHHRLHNSQHGLSINSKETGSHDCQPTCGTTIRNSEIFSQITVQCLYACYRSDAKYITYFNVLIKCTHWHHPLHWIMKIARHMENLIVKNLLKSQISRNVFANLCLLRNSWATITSIFQLPIIKELNTLLITEIH